MNSNVVTLKPSMISNANLFFPVSIHPIQAVKGGSTYGRLNNVFQAVVRDDTEEIIAVHGDRFRLTKNEEIFPRFDNVIRASGLITDNLAIKDQISHNGARAIRTYTFNDHKVEIAKGDVVALELKVINSYDGAFAFQTLLGALRLVCTNGLVIGQTFSRSYGKHTSGLDIDAAVARTRGALDIYLQNTQMWQEWTTTKIDDNTAIALINRMPNINDKLAHQIFGYWETEKVELGSTLWALFNALTYWSTHADVRASSIANAPTIVLDREARVRRVVTHPEWHALAA